MILGDVNKRCPQKTVRNRPRCPLLSAIAFSDMDVCRSANATSARLRLAGKRRRCGMFMSRSFANAAGDYPIDKAVVTTTIRLRFDCIRPRYDRRPICVGCTAA